MVDLLIIWLNIQQDAAAYLQDKYLAVAKSLSSIVNILPYVHVHTYRNIVFVSFDWSPTFSSCVIYKQPNKLSFSEVIVSTSANALSLLPTKKHSPSPNAIAPTFYIVISFSTVIIRTY